MVIVCKVYCVAACRKKITFTEWLSVRLIELYILKYVFLLLSYSSRTAFYWTLTDHSKHGSYMKSPVNQFAISISEFKPKFFTLLFTKARVHHRNNQLTWRHLEEWRLLPSTPVCQSCVCVCVGLNSSFI